MAEIVCQVLNRENQVELVWSSGGGFFRPYVIAGAKLGELREATLMVRKALGEMVYALNQSGDGPVPWEPSYGLAEAGFRLHNCLLPTEEDTAKKVRRWIEDLRRKSRLISLEIVVEEQSADARAFLSVPWNLVYDERPAKHKAAFQGGQGTERWRPFWSIRYNLTSGRRVEPLRRLPVWSNPRVIAAINPDIYEEMHADQKQKLDAFLDETGITRVGSMAELEQAMEEGYPQLFYYLGHATPDYLTLGNHETVTPSDLRNLLRSFDDRERPEGMLAFLNACQTAEAGSGRVVPGRAAQLRIHRGDRDRAADDRQLRQRVRPGVPARLPPGGAAPGRVAARAPAEDGAAGPALRRPLPARDPRARSARTTPRTDQLCRSTRAARVAGVRLGAAGRSRRMAQGGRGTRPELPDAAVPLAGLLRPGRPRPVHGPRRRHRPVRRDARPAGHADPGPAWRERHGQVVVPAGRGDPLPGGGVRRLPLPPPGRRFDRDHPAGQGPGRQIAQALLDATATPLDYETPAGEPIRDRPSPGDRRGRWASRPISPRSARRCGGMPACSRRPAGADGRPIAARPGPGLRPGRGGLHAGQDARGGRRSRPCPADAPARGRHPGRRQADHLAADRVLRPPARPPAGRPPRPHGRAGRPAPRFLPAR